MIRSGIQDWWLCRNRTCTQPNRVPNLGGRLYTRLFLERWTRDWRKGAELRRLLTEAGGRARPIHEFTDSDVADQITQLIERGDLHIHAAAPWVHVEENFSESGNYKPPPSPAFPLASRNNPADSNSGPASSDDPSTFGNIDTGAQVAALMAASSQGAPFCPE